MDLSGYYRRFIKNNAFIALRVTTLFKKDQFIWTHVTSEAFSNLKQAKHWIAYFSKKLNLRMQWKSTYVREIFAISKAMAKFRQCILGHKFIIQTDQKNLKSLMNQTIQTPEQQGRLHKFLGFDSVIGYKLGIENVAANAL